MGKRTRSMALTAALVAGVFTALPAGAQESPTAIPELTQIADPFGDANTQTGDQVHPADASSVGDIGKVWFSNTADTISLHFQVEGNPPASASNVRYNVYANPEEGKTGTSSCLRFEIIPVNPANPGAYAGETVAKVLDRCPAPPPGTFYKPENGTKGELKIEVLADKTGLMTATFPRSASPAFGPGKTISQPFAIDYIGGGTDKVSLPATQATNEGPPGFSGLRLDDTKVGTDYVIADGGEAVRPPAEPKPEPPGKNDPPGKGKKKGCGKGKGKQKGACPSPTPPPAAGCAPYVPGEDGAEAGETIKVTDKATADAPVEVTVDAPEGHGNDLGLGAYDGTQSVFRNLQIDSAAAEAGLYLTYEFPLGEDHDIYLNYASGNEAAHSGGFNPVPVPVAFGCCDGTGAGGHATQTSENLEGIRSKDCQGYTLRLSSFISPGGEMTLKLWLGEPTYDPPADEPPAESAMEMFYRALGL